MERQFYIVSRKHESKFAALFWRAAGHGYTHRLDWAGKFTLQGALDLTRDSRDSFAVPAEDIERMATQVVQLDMFDGELTTFKDEWKILVDHATATIAVSTKEVIDPKLKYFRTEGGDGVIAAYSLQQALEWLRKDFGMSQRDAEEECDEIPTHENFFTKQIYTDDSRTAKISVRDHIVQHMKAFPDKIPFTVYTSNF